MNEPVKLKIYPIYGEYCGNSRVIVGSRESCGKCGASVPRNVKYCPDCGVPIYVSADHAAALFQTEKAGINARIAARRLLKND